MHACLAAARGAFVCVSIYLYTHTHMSGIHRCAKYLTRTGVTGRRSSLIDGSTAAGKMSKAVYGKSSWPELLGKPAAEAATAISGGIGENIKGGQMNICQFNNLAIYTLIFQTYNSSHDYSS